MFGFVWYMKWDVNCLLGLSCNLFHFTHHYIKLFSLKNEIRWKFNWFWKIGIERERERVREKTIVALAPPVTSLVSGYFYSSSFAKYNTTYTILILHNNNKELNTIKQYNIVMKLLIISLSLFHWEHKLSIVLPCFGFFFGRHCLLLLLLLLLFWGPYCGVSMVII